MGSSSVFAVWADPGGDLGGKEDGEGELAEEDEEVEVVDQLGVQVDVEQVGDDAGSVGECAEGSGDDVEGKSIVSRSGVRVPVGVGDVHGIIEFVLVIDIFVTVYIFQGLHPKWIAWIAITTTITTRPIFLSILIYMLL
jgi:hypothetical protein